MSQYTWKVTPQGTIEFYDPTDVRLATLDTSDMENPVIDGVASEEAAEEANALVEHLNNPLPGNDEEEYVVSEMSFGGPGLDDGETLIDVETPDGERIASITDFDDGDALLQHFNRNHGPNNVH